MVEIKVGIHGVPQLHLLVLGVLIAMGIHGLDSKNYKIFKAQTFLFALFLFFKVEILKKIIFK